MPKAFSETGYDTNPAQSLSDAKGSAFGRTGAGFNLSSVSPGTIASLNAAGSFLDYLNDAALAEFTRYAGSANTSITYLVRPGVTVSSGAFITYDGESANKTQSDGATAELAMEAVSCQQFALSFKQVEYLDGEGVANDPLVLSSAYNYSRSDITWVGLLGRGWAASPYVEVSGARVDYTDQSDPAAWTAARTTITPRRACACTFPQSLPPMLAGASIGATPKIGRWAATTPTASTAA